MTAPLSQGGAATAAGMWVYREGPAIRGLRQQDLNRGPPLRSKWRSRPISRVLSWTVIPLGASSPIRSSSLPGPDAGRVVGSLFGLAPGGVCRAGLLPGSRCALTAPFHPCLCPCGSSAVSFCCTFRRLAPPRRYLAPCPVEPGLSSASALRTGKMTRLPGRLRHAHCRMVGTAGLALRRAFLLVGQRPGQDAPGEGLGRFSICRRHGLIAHRDEIQRGVAVLEQRHHRRDPGHRRDGA